MKRYTKEHLCIEYEGLVAQRFGKANDVLELCVTKYGRDQLGEIAYVSEVEEREFKKGETLMTIESAKACHDILAPCDLNVIDALKMPFALEEMKESGFVCHFTADDEIGETMTGEEYEEYCAMLRD